MKTDLDKYTMLAARRELLRVSIERGESKDELKRMEESNDYAKNQKP